MEDVCALRERDETGYCDGFSLISPFFTDAAAAADADAKAAAHRWKTAQSGIRKSFVGFIRNWFRFGKLGVLCTACHVLIFENWFQF